MVRVKIVSPEFFKSTFSGGDQTCVEVSHRAEVSLIRDSKYTGPGDLQPILEVAAESWSAFLDAVLTGATTHRPGLPSITVDPDGSAVLADAGAVTLEYTAEEWDAFIKGVAAAQFHRRK